MNNYTKKFLFLIISVILLFISPSYASNELYLLQNISSIGREIREEYYIPIDDATLFSGAAKEIANKKKISVKKINSREEFYTYFQELCSKYPGESGLLYEYAVRGMIDSLNDPYALFFNREQWAHYKKVSSGAEFAGIGVELAMKEKYFEVVAPISESPAERAGLLPGDTITAIDSQDISKINLTDALNLFDGYVGSYITLKIKRGGKLLNFKLKRENISLPPPKASILKSKSGNIGYIKIYYFGDKTDSQVKVFLEKLKNNGITNIIIDLRNNPGGDFQASLRLASFFTGKNILVKLMKKGKVENIYGTSETIYNFNTAVLINNGSASASEVFSCALRENGKCTLIGTKSFGKALVQSVYTLPGNSGCKLTTAKYYNARGTDILGKGLTPDVKVNTIYPMPQPSADPVISKAVNILSVNRK